MKKPKNKGEQKTKRKRLKERKGKPQTWNEEDKRGKQDVEL
jgi:hypothetical protein